MGIWYYELTGASSSQSKESVITKAIQGHWRLQNERDLLKRFQGKTPNLRPLLDEIHDPVELSAIVLKYFDDDLLHASVSDMSEGYSLIWLIHELSHCLRRMHKFLYFSRDNLTS